MFDKFDMENIDRKVYRIGALTQEVIDILSLDARTSHICISEDKITYTKKHEHKYKDYNEYKKCVEEAPNILACPDYVGLHPNGDSIEYIKRIDQIMLVAVRVKKTGTLWVKSVFPISESKLELYLQSGSLKKIGQD